MAIETILSLGNESVIGCQEVVTGGAVHFRHSISHYVFLRMANTADGSWSREAMHGEGVAFHTSDMHPFRMLPVARGGSHLQPSGIAALVTFLACLVLNYSVVFDVLQSTKEEGR